MVIGKPWRRIIMIRDPALTLLAAEFAGNGSNVFTDSR
jgi:hypothetical protein